MGLLILIGILALLYYFAKNSNKNAQARKRQAEEALLRGRNREWVSFIIGYKTVVKTEAEKKLIARMLDDIQDQGLVSANEIDWLENQAATETGVESMPANAVSAESASGAAAMQHDSVQEDARGLQQIPKDAQAVRLDNISLLLYFGAFLFVAAVGLFVAFAGAGGWIRTLAVLFVTLALYATGQWVYRTKPALRPAGLAFAGIGAAIAPLVGMAAFSYIQSVSPQVVWFVTSLFCMALYSHALVSLKKPLINYIFIFTLLSLFESGAAILNAPIYYFGWVMAAIGLLLQVAATTKGFWPEFRESSRAGSQLYIPLAVMASLMILPAHGFGQFGVSLLLAALYYGLESWRATAAQTREALAVASHISLLVGLASIFYGFSSDAALTGIFVAAVSLAHIVVLALWHSMSKIIQNIATVMLASTFVSIIMLAEQAPMMTIVLGLGVLQALFVWWRQKRSDAFVLAALGWMVLPLVFGKLALSPALSTHQLIILSITALATHIGFYLALARPRFAGMQEAARWVMLMHTALVAAMVLFASPGFTLGALLVISLILLALSLFDQDNVWEVASGIVISLAVLRCWSDTLLLVALMIALAYNILLALRFRSEANRWLSTGLWLLLPAGMGGATTSQHWGAAEYAWAYIAVMLGLVISRGIARGAVFPSAKIPLTSYARTASLSYVAGYIVAGSLAAWISLFAAQSQFHTTAILGVISLMIFILARFIEKRPDMMAIQPVLWQFMLMSGLRPENAGSSLALYVLASTGIAVACYVLYRMFDQGERAKQLITSDFGQSAVLVSFVAPASILYATELVWAMPVGLLAAGVLLFEYWRSHAQEYKETAAAVIVAAFMWFLYYAGVREIQAYTHILALMFAGFAWWRHELQDRESSESYIYTALAAATVPLLIQALSADAGGLYGWWLLIEQVIFILIGMAIRRRFVVMWGLYVAVGSVLYQLRHLGYAALAVLAMFVIGVAVYQLQKYNNPDADQ